MLYLHQHMSRRERLFVKKIQNGWNGLSTTELGIINLQFSIVFQLQSVDKGHIDIVKNHLTKGEFTDALEKLSSVVGTEVAIELTREIRNLINAQQK